MHPRILTTFILISTCAAIAQTPPAAAPAATSKECGIKAIQICALHVAQDELGIVTAPFRISKPDLPMLAFVGAGTGIALATDVDAMQEVGLNPSREHNANTYSNVAGLYAPAVAVTAGFFLGSAKHSHRLQETSILAEEAMADSFFLNTGLGYAIDRENPTQGNGKGDFWPHGTKTWPDGQSMPSDHSILVWSFAHVVASEYNGWATKVVVYSLATSVSTARVIARKHFPSDVFVGGALGYYIGGYVVHRRATEVSWSNNFSLAPARTPNGNGIEISYNFAH
jgi:membrane-associated phospholipid phosphatase